MTPLDKIQYVLDLIYKDPVLQNFILTNGYVTKREIANKVVMIKESVIIGLPADKRKKVTIPNTELIEILERLCIDGYLKNGENKDEYKTTFHGTLFTYKGGYVNEERRNTISEILQLSMTVVIALGTMVGGLYYFFELWKYFYPYDGKENKMIFLQFACGCIFISNTKVVKAAPKKKNAMISKCYLREKAKSKRVLVDGWFMDGWDWGSLLVFD